MTLDFEVDRATSALGLGSSSSFRRQHAGALWLRVITSQYQQQSTEELLVVAREQIVFEAKIADAEIAGAPAGGTAQWRSKSTHVKIRNNTVHQEQDREDRAFPCLVLELWETEAYSNVASAENDGFLSFIGAARVDLKRWEQESATCPTRWYVLQSGRSAKREAWSAESKFEEYKEHLLSGEVYFRASLGASSSLAKKKNSKSENAREAIPGSPPSSFPSFSANNEFQFVIPSQTITTNRRFLATRVGEVIHEGNTEYLQELLPVVLYGKAQLRSAHAVLPTSRHQKQECCCLNKGLRLLQLSCQYACYCANKLDDDARKIESKQSKLVQQRAKLQAKREKMELRRRNLRRELRVLDSALDGMRLLLQQVDPDCLELLQQDM